MRSTDSPIQVVYAEHAFTVTNTITSMGSMPRAKGT
jgi:hypothetical protein